ncbi:MAG: hypothetical protein EBR01_11990 [Proteobacteria bacterium]|nr:hypothetical protein [Pseudomonadota bacterium]
MFSRDYFIPSLSTVLVAGLVAFLSCSHQSRYSELDESFSELVTEKDSSEESSSSMVLQDAPVIEPQPSSPNEEPSAMVAEVAVEEYKTTNNQIDQEDSDSSRQNSLIELRDAGAKVAVEEPVNNETSSSASLQMPPEPVVSPAPMIAPVSVPKLAYHVPKIPRRAIKRKEGLLNRFYFVRAGDTPESVSNLIYGSPDKGHQFWVSKGMKWAPGRIIYYNSAKNPNDPQMVSLYKEENVSGKSIRVNRGSWLSKLAKKYLGSPKSWTEIAVMNLIEDPLDLKVGQKLILFPEIQPKTTNPTHVAVSAPPAQPSNLAPEVPENKILAQATAPILNPEPQPEIAPPQAPAPDVPPRTPLAVEESDKPTKMTARDYIRSLIEKFSRLMRRKYEIKN